MELSSKFKPTRRGVYSFNIRDLLVLITLLLILEAKLTLLRSGKRRGRWGKFSLLVRLPSLFYRYVGFTRNANLAEATAVTFITISLLDILTGSQQVLTASFLVVAGSGERPNRAAINAFAA